MLLRRGVDIDSRDDDGWTTFHYAAESGCTSVVRLLLSFGMWGQRWVDRASLCGDRRHVDVGRLLADDVEERGRLEYTSEISGRKRA
ncbi:hypothetical protein K440DRAFT_624422 [Wilcoxina mikolae CBS 423.85]|nr:hypothetical protein K440DRAFT_624422 [Wilcoxina mikolae CBS 423.85]